MQCQAESCWLWIKHYSPQVSQTLVSARHWYQTFQLLGSWNIWWFPKMGAPQHGWFIREHFIKMDDLVVPLF